MADMLTFFDPSPAGPANTVVELFDPPMCCPTGICGPAIDQSLLDVNDMVLQLQGAGVRVERYQMTTSPQAFVNNPEVMRLVREREMAALPITAVDGRVIKSGAYPTLAEVKSALNGALG